MKQKYSLSIADIQLSVVADADQEQVDKIVGILDRRMREIFLRSRCCTKNEAALLCALDFCADKLILQEENTELEERNEKYATVLDHFKLKVEDLEAELARLQSENEVLRSVLSTETVASRQTEEFEASVPEAPTAETAAVHPVSPTEFLAQVADAQTGSEEVPEGAHAPESDADQSQSSQGRKNRSRVGSMFDLLSFNEV